MKIAVVTLTLSLITAPAYAMCVGTNTFQSCTDNSGNNYTINRMGNTTMMQGNNYRTGSNWNQTSTTFGNTTFHNGVDKDGDSWSSTCVNGFCN
ncbi:hypothetical protein [Ensifer adhaerens]